MVIHQGHCTSAAVNRCYHISATFQCCAKLELLLVVIVRGEAKPDKQKSPNTFSLKCKHLKSYCNFKFHYSVTSSSKQVRFFFFHRIKPSSTIKKRIFVPLCSIFSKSFISCYLFLTFTALVYLYFTLLCYTEVETVVYFSIFFFWAYSKLVMAILSFVKLVWDYCGEPWRRVRRWCFQRLHLCAECSRLLIVMEEDWNRWKPK